MTNAKAEFLEEISYKRGVVAAYLKSDNYDGTFCVLLPTNFSEEQYNKFLEDINVDYDSGYGSQELDGVIWYDDGSWSARAEYDDIEWW